jgi:hypothetical protein
VTVVHIAAPPEDRVQECSRCGQIIADIDDKESLAPLAGGESFYKPGAFVAITQLIGYENRYVQKTDATKDQEQCRALPVDVVEKRRKS